MPRFARITHETDRGFHAQWIYGAADFALSASGADYCVDAGAGNAAENGADLGRAAARNARPSSRRYACGNDREKTFAGAAGAEGRCDWDYCGNADGSSRDDELHE